MNATAKTTATGRRKSAVARVYLRPSVGGEDQMIVVNGESGDDYFNREILMLLVKQPLEATETVGQFDFICNVKGGGKAGQAGAVRHGISRALESFNPDLRPVLKKGGFLTRDARIKERKKYGQKGARARFQFSKR
jgi:small subunit ribosomal protein S9